MGSDAMASMVRRGVKRQKLTTVWSDHEGSVSSAPDCNLTIESNSESEEDDLFDDVVQIGTPSSAPPSRSGSQHPSDAHKSFHCNFERCDKSFNRPAKLRQHFRTHTNERPFVCPHTSCRKAFLRDGHLRQHIIASHTDVRDYACTWPDCDKAFTTATRLRRHIEVHEEREKLRCTYEGCGQSFRKQSTLDVHVARVHANIKPFACSFLDDHGKICSSRFDTVHRLKDHEGRVHRTKRYICLICSGPTREDETSESVVDEPVFTFSTYSALKQHTDLRHPPTCAECGLRCATSTTLKSHMEVCHGGLSLGERKQFRCPEANCGAGFTKQGNLKLHLRTIHAERRFVCDLGATKLAKGLESWDGHDACGITLPAKSQMVEHVRTRHLGLAPGPLPRNRKAKKVTKTGTVIDDLVRSEESPQIRSEIDCPVDFCGRTFVRDYDMEQHLIATHQLSDQDLKSLARDSAGRIEAFRVRSSLSGEAIIVSQADLEAERLFEGMDDHPGGDEDVGRDDFWIGGTESFGQAHQSAQPWFEEEMEMRRLIDDELL